MKSWANEDISSDPQTIEIYKILYSFLFVQLFHMRQGIFDKGFQFRFA